MGRDLEQKTQKEGHELGTWGLARRHKEKRSL